MELVMNQSSKWAYNIKAWFVRALEALIEARQAEANRRIAEMHLYRMSDRELNDIGIGRGDIKRIVKEGK
jgi:uncharacterized protein YjiS (DUF1127 family)